MTPQEPWKNMLAVIETAILSVLAFPFTVVAAIVGLRKIVKIAMRINEGKLVCAFCRTENPLNLMSRCVCGAVEPAADCDAVSVVPFTTLSRAPAAVQRYGSYDIQA